MKIRRKISLIFTILTSIVLLVSFAVVYYLSGKYSQADFYDRLLGKATLTAWKYFEKDEMAVQGYQKIIEDYNQTLPEAKEIVMDVADTPKVKDSLLKIMPLTLANELLKGGKVRFKHKSVQGVGLYYPDNQGNFIVIISAVDKYGIKKQENLLKILLLIFFGSIVFIYVIGHVYARKMLAPIVHVLRNVQLINATNLSLRLEENKGNDELAELVRMFNQMLERLEDSFTMQRNFIHNASHELKNPITAILGESEIALNRKRQVEEYIATIKIIVSEAERLDQITRNLLALAQADFDLSSKPLEEIHLDKLISEVHESFEKTNYRGRLEVHIAKKQPNEKYVIYGIHYLLYMAIANIVENACKFSGIHKVKIYLDNLDDHIYISVIDKGIGIPTENLQDIFQPFYRGSNALSFKGNGIGLSLVEKIVKLHKGKIKVDSKTNSGTMVELHFLAETTLKS
jgi:signal transduction histidine kinase